MEKPNESVKLLNMFLHPVFTVKDGIITDCNYAAKVKQIPLGESLSAFIPDCMDEYQAYHGGFLSLPVKIEEDIYLATIVRTEDMDVFHLLTSDTTVEFRTMSLISQQIRKPLSNILCAADTLLPAITSKESQEQANQINKNLYQLLRTACNLSTAQKITAQEYALQQTEHLTGLINSVMESAVALVSQSRRDFQFTSLYEDIHGLADSELLERALFNLVSNAIKFSPADTAVTAKLVRSGNKLRFIIQNQIVPGTDLSNIFARFMREPGIEDSRHGVGLGIPLVQHVAAAHNGSLLMDQPAEDTVRFTLTITIQQNAQNILRSTPLMFDYLGGHNHALVELSDVLSDTIFGEYI